MADLPLNQSSLKNLINATFESDVSDSYVSRFLDKHEEELVVSKCKILANKRTSSYTLPFVDYFIEKFTSLVEKRLVTSKNLLNYDESRVGPQHGDKSTGLKIVVRGNKKHNIAGSRLHVISSIVPFVSPLGKVFCVFYISKAKFTNEDEAWVQYNIVPFKWKRFEGFPEFFMYSDTGFVNEAVFKAMIEKVDELWHGQNPGLDVYLLGDNCRVHLNLDLMFDMAKTGSHLIFLPPNTTVFSQPLDQNMFAAVKALVYKLLEEKLFDMLLLGKRDEYWTIPAAQIAAHKALTESVIRSGFEETGIWPWNAKLLKANAEKLFPLDIIDPRKEVCLNLVKTVIFQSQASSAKRKSQVISNHVVVKKHYAYDFQDHIEMAELQNEEQRQKEKDEASRKRKRQEEKESIKRARLAEKEKKKEMNTCKECGMTWRGSTSWVGCSHCDMFWICVSCSKSNNDIITAHESSCKKKKKH